MLGATLGAVSGPEASEAERDAPDPGFSRILVVDDEEPLRHMLALILDREGFEVTLASSGEEALAQLAVSKPDVMLSDVRMPGMGGLELVTQASSDSELTIVVMSAFGSVDLAIEAMKRGAYDYISKPFKQDEVILALRKAEERERLRRENTRLRARLRSLGNESDRLGDMLIHSPGMKTVAEMVRKVARFKTTALVLGESGVGKELVSRALHGFSPRVDGPFIAVNCGAIPETLLESELFGHMKGAFTDANRDKMGLFEAANGGTLFLDEIGEMPAPLQVKLLRALQEDEIRPVGSNASIKVDVRVVAATSRQLEDMVQEGSFREDLFYRLNVMPLHVPPLRERRDDIGPLADHFVQRINARLGTTIAGISADSLRVLRGYDWPGNVRELENTLEHAAVLAESEWIEAGDLPERLTRAPSEAGFSIEFSDDDLSVKRANRRLERELILRALAQTAGNRTHAAKLLDLSHRALLYKIKDFGLGG
jgi:DNA-binding NtrC family response regulator